MVDIIVVNNGNLFLIKSFLSHLKANTSVPYNLYVVDNDSKNGSIDYLRQKSVEDGFRFLETTLELYPQQIAPFDAEKTIPPYAIMVDHGERVLSHGQCVDLARERISSEFHVVIDSDCLVQTGWLERMLKEMSDERVACVGNSKLGPYNLSRIWVSNCLYRTNYVCENKVTMHPLIYRYVFYDTGDYQSAILSMQYRTVHISEHMKYWNHLGGIGWFSNCLVGGVQRAHFLFNEDGSFAAEAQSRPANNILKASWWYQKLYRDSLPNDVDVAWSWEDHLSLAESIKESSMPFVDCEQYLVGKEQLANA
jgi:GT2 family glycosyltransferase